VTGMRAIVAVGAALLLAACGTSAPSSSGGSPSSGGGPSASGAAGASSLSGRDIGLELRPVLDEQPASAGQCSSGASASPSINAAATASPVTACATDGSLVYTLGPAVVTGTRWDSMRLDQDPASGAWQIFALLDPQGASAFTQATAELSTEDDPRNMIAFYYRGTVEAAPTVQQPIYGGRVVFGQGLDKASAQQLLDELVG